MNREQIAVAILNHTIKHGVVQGMLSSADAYPLADAILAAQQDVAREAAVAVFRESIQAFLVRMADRREIDPKDIAALVEQNAKAFDQLVVKRLEQGVTK